MRTINLVGSDKRTDLDECDEPCERLVKVERRVDALEEVFQDELRKQFRHQRAHMTKLVSSITTIATLIIGILSAYQAKSQGTPQELRDAIQQTVKQVLIDQNKGSEK